MDEDKTSQDRRPERRRCATVLPSLATLEGAPGDVGFFCKIEQDPHDPGILSCRRSEKEPIVGEARYGSDGAPLLCGGRMMETGPSFSLRNSVGSGKISLVWNVICI